MLSWFIRSFFGFLLILVLLYSCSGGSDKVKTSPQVEIQGQAQGTTFTVKYLTNDSLDLSVDIAKLLEAIDMQLSSWKDSSTISNFNRTIAYFREVKKSDSLFVEMYNQSKEVYIRSEGAFNPAIMPLVKYWGFAKSYKEQKNVDSTKVDSLLQHIGFSKLNYVQKVNYLFACEDSLLQLDFNAIAQGYSVDLICDLLESKGLNNYMVELGGEVRAKGKNSEGNTWTIGIDKPLDKSQERTLQAKVKLDGKALATSGNYRKFYEIDGVKYSHTIDPKTGFPVQHSLLSASVVANTCATADAYATVFMVIGLEAGKIFLERNKDLNLSVYFIYSDEKGNYQTWMSEGMKSILEEL